jgi:uncharacterized protein
MARWLPGGPSVDRLATVRRAVDEILRQQPDDEERRCGFVHLYGVADTCVLLALKRGLDPQLSAVAGMLHDIWTYKTADAADHARLGALEAAGILQGLACFTPGEIALVSTAISRHSNKGARDGEMAELLKDADVLQHYLYNPALEILPGEKARLVSILDEMGLVPMDEEE